MTKLHISIFFKTILFTWNTHKLICNQPMKTRFTVSICGTRDKKKWEPLVTLELCQIYIQTSTHSVGGILSFMMTTWYWAGHSNVYNGTIKLTNKPHRSSNKNDKKWHLQSCPVLSLFLVQTKHPPLNSVSCKHTQRCWTMASSLVEALIMLEFSSWELTVA